jgi:hypothetical protein
MLHSAPRGRDSSLIESAVLSASAVSVRNGNASRLLDSSIYPLPSDGDNGDAILAVALRAAQMTESALWTHERASAAALQCLNNRPLFRVAATQVDTTSMSVALSTHDDSGRPRSVSCQTPDCQPSFADKATMPTTLYDFEAAARARQLVSPVVARDRHFTSSPVTHVSHHVPFDGHLISPHRNATKPALYMDTSYSHIHVNH